MAFADHVADMATEDVPCRTYTGHPHTTNDFSRDVSDNSIAFSDVCTTEPGDCIAFHIRTWHCSVGGSENRRSLNLDIFRTPRNAAEEQALCSLGKGHASSNRGFDCVLPFNYSQAWLRGGGDIRQIWVEKFREIGYLDGSWVAEGGPQTEEQEQASASQRLAASL